MSYTYRSCALRDDEGVLVTDSDDNIAVHGFDRNCRRHTSVHIQR